MTVATLTDDVLSSSQTSFIRLMSGELTEWKKEKEWNVLMWKPVFHQVASVTRSVILLKIKYYPSSPSSSYRTPLKHHQELGSSTSLNSSPPPFPTRYLYTISRPFFPHIMQPQTITHMKDCLNVGMRWPSRSCSSVQCKGLVAYRCLPVFVRWLRLTDISGVVYIY